MSVINEDIREVYTGDGSTTEFDVDFRVLDVSHLAIYKRNTSTDVVTSLAYGDDYTVEIDEDEGATVTFLSAPTASEKIYIYSDSPYTQETEIEPDSDLPEETLESAYDKITVLVKQLKERLDRALKFPVTSDSVALEPTLPEPDPGKGLIWDSSGVALINTDDDVNGILSGAQTARTAAEAAETAAETAQAAAEAALAAFEAQAVQTDFDITAGQSATALAGYEFDGDEVTSQILVYEVIRGTTIHAIGTLKCFFKNGTWVFSDSYDEPAGNLHGLTWSFDQTGNVGALEVAANGGDDGTLKIKQNPFNVAS